MTDLAKAMPSNINLEKWEDVGFLWNGELLVKELPRLASLVADNDGALIVSAKLNKQAGILWLVFDVQGALILTCQRCLDRMELDVSGEYRLAILHSDDEINRIDGAEYVLLDELGEDTRKMLPLKDLLEDELILLLPASPRHEDCQSLLGEMTEVAEEQNNPFAVLADLKGKLS
ncbi:MAG: YceD family protein [Moraxella sp.]|nr:YceD family protein [Moraxella sp.]